MALDLAFLPTLSADSWISQQVIDVELDEGMYELLKSLQPAEVPRSVRCYVARDETGEPHYGNLLETPYGGRLTFLTVEKLLTIKDHPLVAESRWNKALWALLRCFSDRTQIVLYWH